MTRVVPGPPNTVNVPGPTFVNSSAAPASADVSAIASANTVVSAHKLPERVVIADILTRNRVALILHLGILTQDTLFTRVRTSTEAVCSAACRRRVLPPGTSISLRPNKVTRLDFFSPAAPHRYLDALFPVPNNRRRIIIGDAMQFHRRKRAILPFHVQLVSTP